MVLYYHSMKRVSTVSARSKQRAEQVQEDATSAVSEINPPASSVCPSPTDSRCAPRRSERPLGPDDFDVLKEMVQAYKAHRLDFSVLPRRPKFKNPKVNTGITVSADIRQRSLEKAQSDPDGTGGSLSSLIELLLWMFLECPQDVVERYPR